jgi:hypothetical protein
MSKIQINELNNSSELEVLNAQETTEVVGGFYYGYGSYKYAEVFQNNYNETNQAALTYFGDASNSNTTDQSNSANVYQ